MQPIERKIHPMRNPSTARKEHVEKMSNKSASIIQKNKEIAWNANGIQAQSRL